MDSGHLLGHKVSKNGSTILEEVDLRTELMVNPMQDLGDIILGDVLGVPLRLAAPSVSGIYLLQITKETSEDPDIIWKKLTELLTGTNGYIQKHSNGTLQDSVIFEDGDGNVGIGTDDPEELIHALQTDTSLAANILLASDRTGVGGKAGFMLKSNETGNHARFIYRRQSESSVLSDEVLLTFRDEPNAIWNQLIHYRLINKRLRIGQGADVTEFFGSVGLGVSPTRTLDINGDARIRNLKDTYISQRVYVDNSGNLDLKKNVSYYLAGESNQPNTTSPGTAVVSDGEGYIYLYKHMVSAAGGYRIKVDIHSHCYHNTNASDSEKFMVTDHKTIEFTMYIEPVSGQLRDFSSSLKFIHNSGNYIRTFKGTIEENDDLELDSVKVSLDPVLNGGLPEYERIKIENKLWEILDPLTGKYGGSEPPAPEHNYPLYVKYFIEIEHFVTTETQT